MDTHHERFKEAVERVVEELDESLKYLGPWRDRAHSEWGLVVVSYGAGLVYGVYTDGMDTGSITVGVLRDHYEKGMPDELPAEPSTKEEIKEQVATEVLDARFESYKRLLTREGVWRVPNNPVARAHVTDVVYRTNGHDRYIEVAYTWDGSALRGLTADVEDFLAGFYFERY